MIHISWITPEELKQQPKEYQDLEFLLENNLEYEVCSTGEYFVPTHTETVAPDEFYIKATELVTAGIPTDQIVITTASGNNSLYSITKFPPMPGSVIRYHAIDILGKCEYLGEVLPADNEAIEASLSPEADDLFCWMLKSCYLTEDDICFNVRHLNNQEIKSFSILPAAYSTVAGTNLRNDICEDACITSKQCLHPIKDGFINTFGARLLYLNHEEAITKAKQLPSNKDAEEVSLLYCGYDVYDPDGVLTGVITFAQDGNMRLIPLESDNHLYLPKYFRPLNRLIMDKLTEEDKHEYEDIYSSNEFLTQFCMNVPHWIDLYNADIVAETNNFITLFLRLADSYKKKLSTEQRLEYMYQLICSFGEYKKSWTDPTLRDIFTKEKDYISKLSEWAYTILQDNSTMLCMTRR